MDIIKKLKTLSDKELRIFIRQRLGQEDAVFCEKEKPHNRFCFHAYTNEEISRNRNIIHLFYDVLGLERFMVSSYKGDIAIIDENEIDDNVSEIYHGSGDGTVDILFKIIKKRIAAFKNL